MTAIAVTIAGSDSGGGAGIQADLKTFSALGVYGASVVTALTAQNTMGVTGIHDVPPEFIAAQIDAVFSDLKVGAVKIGMLSQAAIIAAVADGLDRPSDECGARSGDGGDLRRPAAAARRGRQSAPPAHSQGPRADAKPAGGGGPARHGDCRGRGRDAAPGRPHRQLGANAVLIKGGHGDGPESVDLLVEPNRLRACPAERIVTRNTHGTGCTLSAAIAAGLAKGMNLTEAVRAAKSYVTEAIAAADRLSIGAGHGPVHHFHRRW